LQEVSDTKTLQDFSEERARKEADDRRADDIAAAEAQFAKEATSAEVQLVLAPFLARRFVQPKLSGASVQFEKVLEEQPMSLSRLEGIGALAESPTGLKMLARVGADRDLPQPRWSFHHEPGNWTPDNQKLLQQAQEMLRKYGIVLVKKGLLSP
jgi:aryl-alcohol dehydrogenase-like predicted oxidoreductase